jgi:hypothetical protein
MASKPRSEQGRDTTPPSFAEVTPSRQASGAGHDFTLQAVMEMQRTLGELCGKVERMGADLKSQGEKLDGVRLTLARVGGGIAVLVVVVGLISAAVKFWPSSGH